MGQIIGGAAKPKRCNLNQLSQVPTPAAGEHILVSSDNSMNAVGQGNFDCYIVGDGRTAATALPLIKTYANDVDDEPTADSDKLVKSGGVAAVIEGGVFTAPYDAKVEYIGFSSNQTWINLNFVPARDDLRVVIDAKKDTDGDNIVFGIQGTSPRLNLNWVYSGRAFLRYRDYNQAHNFAAGRHVFEIAPVMKIDGNVVATPTFSDSVTFVGNQKKIVIGGAPNAPEPTGISFPFNGKVYSFKIYYGGTIFFDGIPVRKNGNGCLYDSVSDTLFENTGSGTITYGNDL